MPWAQAPGPLAPPEVRRPLQRRLEKVSKPIQASSWKAQRRLGTRSRPLSARGNKAHQVVVAIARELRAGLWAMAQEGARTPERETWNAHQPFSRRFDRPAAEARPRCGATLDGVKRPQDTLVPRARQALDGRKEGGNQSTASSMINRRLFLAPPLPMHAGQEDEDNAQESVTSS